MQAFIDALKQIDLTPLLQAIISVVTLIITVKVVPWVKSKTNASQQEALFSAAKIAVYAAEQLYGSKAGQEKRDYAVKKLEEMGYTVDMATIEAAIEAAVKDLKLQGSTLAVPIPKAEEPIEEKEEA